MRKRFFTMKVVRYWNMLGRELVGASSLDAFKDRLDRALSNLIYWDVSLPMGQGARRHGLDDHKNFLTIQTIL